jgi:FdhD protein
MKKIGIIRYKEGKKEKVQDKVAEEIFLKVILNGENISAFSCSGTHVNELITGYLYHHGYINETGEIQSLYYNVENETAYIQTIPKQTELFSENRPSEKNYSIENLLNLMEEFTKRSLKFQETGAFHSSAIATQEKIVLSFDDISRHNTVYSLLGYSILNNLLLQDKILLLTCRLTKSIMDIILKMGIKTIVTKAAPTHRAIETCKENDIKLAGFVRGARMNIYNGFERFS